MSCHVKNLAIIELIVNEFYSESTITSYGSGMVPVKVSALYTRY